MKKEKTKLYETPPAKPNITEKPFVMFGTLDLDESKCYTYADYLTWVDDKRRELIKGFIHLLSAPNELHARITSNWSFWANAFVRKRRGKCRVYHAPFDVRLPLYGSTDDDKIYDVVQSDIGITNSTCMKLPE